MYCTGDQARMTLIENLLIDLRYAISFGRD